MVSCLRLNDDADAAGQVFPELKGVALIRELHVYGVLIAAKQDGASDKHPGSDRAQHLGIGRTLMSIAERLASSRGWENIAVIAGVGVRNYYRRLGYTQTGEGQYLIKPLKRTEPVEIQALEVSFLDASRNPRPPLRQRREVLLAAAAAFSVVSAGVVAYAIGRRWRRQSALGGSTPYCAACA